MLTVVPNKAEKGLHPTPTPIYGFRSRKEKTAHLDP